MLLNKESIKNQALELSTSKRISIFYHDLFDYPLTKTEIEKWATGKRVLSDKYRVSSIKTKKGYYFLKGKEGSILKRLAREKSSVKKLKIARRAGRLLTKIPTVKMVGITGALSMKNANEDSDIDLLIVTSHGLLWTTRLLSYFLFLALGFRIRRPKSSEQKDKLCLNMWLDESDLIFRKRNIFTAHEVTQIIPIVNKDKTYEKLLWKNRWVLDYWPRAVTRKYLVSGTKYQVSKKSLIHNTLNLLLNTVIEPIVYKLQYRYMRSKITRETITKTRAIFHPYDWSAEVLKRL